MTLRLFEGYGIELEYMLVDAETLDVLPRADEVLIDEHGSVEAEIERGAISWSNELVLHVFELKTNGPAAGYAGLEEAFQEEVREVARRIAPFGGRVMPTAMHPWMDPAREARLWPHEYGAVYRAFDRIFSCKGHGWSNLQSAHLNLPFGDADEFGRLHAAIRMVLPLVPAIAASSPIEDGRATGVMDNRLAHYRRNCQRIPLVTAGGIPEPVFTPEAYEREILQRLYAAIAPHDEEGVLQHEWLNARGAIARFDRDAIEIRTVDVQECPRMDLAISATLAALVRRLTEAPDAPAHREWAQARLEPIFLATIRDAERAHIDDPSYLRALGLGRASAMTAGEAWRGLIAQLDVPDRTALEVVMEEGPLARRILTATGPEPTHEDLKAVYGALCDCLEGGRPFVP